MTRKNSSTTSGSAEVTLISETVIECVLRGSITGSIVDGSMAETKKLADQVRSSGRKPRLIIDLREVVKQDSAARSRSKALVTFGLEKIAIYGASRTLKTIGQYIIRIAGMRNYTRFFRTYKGALHWLEQDAVKEPSRKPQLLALSAALTALVGIATLTGWITSNEVLVALSPNFRAMNPMTAISFILLAAAIFLLGRKGAAKHRLLVNVIAGWSIFYGAVISLRHVFQLPVSLDTLLFADKIGLFGQFDGRTPIGSSLLMLGVGLLLLLTQTRLKSDWARYAFRYLTFVLLLALAAIFTGYAFGVVLLVDISQIAVPLNSAFGFLVVTTSVVGAVYTPQLFPTSGRLAKTYGRGFLVGGGLLFLTGISWQQANTNISQTVDAQAEQVFSKAEDALQGRIGAYADALRGYKAFFESSGFVSGSEFDRYFDHSKLQKNYPGFNTISFVRVVTPANRSSFEQEVREQYAEFPELKNFVFSPMTAKPQYVATYLEPAGLGATHGTDVSLLPGRLVTFEAARDADEPRASGSITFDTGNQTEQKGFIISIPIYKAGAYPTTVKERRDRIYGFVNAVFRDEVIFGEIFKSLSNEKDVAFQVTDFEENRAIYHTNTKAAMGAMSPRLSRNVEAAGQSWQITMSTTKDFGVSPVTSTVPRTIFSSGVIVAVLAGFLVVSLSRRREEALALASSMTEDLNNERELAETLRKKDEAILDSIGDAVFAIDKEGHITLFNPAAVKLTGHKMEEAIGKQYDEILSFVAGDGKTATDFIRRALGGHLTAMKADTKLIRKDGSVIDVADSAAPIHDFEGTLQGVIVVFRDVSSERALEQAKSEFVSLASHQLRTPLSAINWYSEMMLDQDAGKLNKDQYEYMKEIYEGNQRMVELVDSLLNVSRLEVGKLKNDPQDVSMVELADSLQKELQTSIVTKKLKLTRAIEPHLPAVYADPKLLRMVMQNLLSNAVKYTPEKGQVTLKIHKATAEEIQDARLRGSDYLFLSVSDTGYGIPKDQQEKIFEKLFRADNVRKMDVEGTGLGLYIVKEVAKKLGGAIWFESTESVGTTFYVVIPFKTKPS